MKTPSLKYGLLIAFGLIFYFLTIRFFNLHYQIWLRYVNALIMALGIYLAIREHKNHKASDFNYISGLATGMKTGVIGAFLFVLFMGIYLFYIDPAFTESILKKWAEYDIGGGTLMFILIIEGTASAAIMSFVYMQWFKISNNM